MAVPYTFGTATASIPLSQLDSNFATAITLGNTAIQLGNTVTTLNNMTLANVTISSGNLTLTNVSATTANVTTANVVTMIVTGNETVQGNTTVTGTITGAKLIPTGTSVTGNGMYLPATNSVGISTAGTNAVYIDASQNVGIGTTSPSTGTLNRQLTINSGASSLAGVVMQNNASGTAYNDGFTIYLGGADASLINYETGALSFGTSAIERMRIDSSGNLLVGTANASPSAGNGFKISSTGRAYSVITTSDSDSYNLYNTTAGAYRFFVTAAGVVNATTTTITAISDQRLKENVRDIDTGLDAIMALKPRRFDWKENKGQDKKNVAGFIAQEFEEVFPESVGVSKAGEDGIKYKNINHETLIPTFVKAIQEQQALITSLTARIEALEAK
jgi:hypothetical protein